MNRRKFIEVSYKSLLLGAIPFDMSFLVKNFAPNQNSHFFVMIYVNDGMDATLGLDPRIHKGTDQKDVFIEYRPDEILKRNNVRLAPAAKALSKYSNDLLIINGVNMRRDSGHESLKEYIASGNGNGVSAILPIEVGALKGTGSIGVLSAMKANQGKRDIVISDLKEVSSFFKSDDLSKKVETLKTINSARRQSGTSYYNAERGLIDSVKAIEKIAGQLKNTTEGQAIAQNSGAPNFIEDFEVQVLALSMANRISNQAVIEFNPNLDTHSNHERQHLAEQTRVWDTIAGIFETFKKTRFGKASLFEATTFMVVTEFSRTPFLNSANGKDHNPYTNSVLLAGKGLQSGKVVGGSQVISRKDTGSEALHFSSAIDYKTGQVVPPEVDLTDDIGLIFPENVAATVAEIFGVRDQIQTISKSAKVIPGVSKTI